MYTGIYRCADPNADGSKIIFDKSLGLTPHNNRPWELVAVARIPEGASFQAHKDASTTHFLVVNSEPVSAMDIPLGEAGPLIVWHRGVVPVGS